VGDTPFGPFVDGRNTPILVTDKANNILSPGHHAVFNKDVQDYILYHRHSIPFDPKFIGRQICVDELKFTADGQIDKVMPTHEGPAFLQGRTTGRRNLADSATVTASSQRDQFTGPERLFDDNYATRWAAGKDTRGGWLQLDFGKEQRCTSQELRLEYAWKPYRFKVDSSDDGKQWKTAADHTSSPATGSPILIEKPLIARYLRLVFPEDVKGDHISIFEWAVY
jgi:arabinoxylan arabinofuranohydrolase